MIKYAYTGYSCKQDGFLVFSDKDWDEVASTLDARHVVHSEDGVETDLFILNSRYGTVSVEDVEEPRWGVWHVFRAEVKTDENLASAVCW